MLYAQTWLYSQARQTRLVKPRPPSPVEGFDRAGVTCPQSLNQSGRIGQSLNIDKDITNDELFTSPLFCRVQSPAMSGRR